MAEQTGNDICSICLNDFQEPKIINCQHSFCYNCLEDYVHRTSANGHFLCPICRQSINVPLGGVKEFSSVQQMASDSSHRIQQCEICLNIQATCRCRNCQQHLCESCTSTHDKLVGCKGHTVVKLVGISKQDLKKSSSEIPDAGAKDSDSGKAKSTPVNPADFCPKHSDKKIKIYCQYCFAAVCLKCFVNEHNGHKFLDLQEADVREQIRHELKTIKVEIEKHINKLQNYSTSLQSKLYEVEEATRSARAKVDTHVRNICAKVHGMGENIKEEIQQICNDENKKFTKLMTDIKSRIEILQTGVKFSTNILKENSIVPVLERLPKVRQEADQCRSRQFNIPDVIYPSFKGTRMNEAVLWEQLGAVHVHLETRFINTFNINQFKHDDELYSLVTTFHGLPWFVSVRNKSYGDPGVFLFLDKTYRRSDILSCQVNYSLVLINQTDENRSMATKDTRSLKDFQHHSGFGFNNFITWDILTNQGFLDSSNNFSIHVVLKLMDVKRGNRHC